MAHDTHQSHDPSATPAPVARAHAMFRAVIPGWASDALALRARGLDRPGHRDALALATRPPAPTDPRGPAPWSITPHTPAWPQPTLRRAG